MKTKFILFYIFGLIWISVCGQNKTDKVQKSALSEDRDLYIQYFQAASNEFSVPVDILKGISFCETRWSHLTWAPEDTVSCMGMPHPYGIMSLWDNDFFGNSLKEAASLIGKDVQELKDNPLQNIRGAAALLKKKYDSLQIPDGTFQEEIESWRNAIAAYSGLPKKDLAQQHSLDIYTAINMGYHQHGINWDKRMVKLDEIKTSVNKIIKEQKIKEKSAYINDNVEVQPDYPLAKWASSYTGHWYTTGVDKKFVVLHVMEGYYLSTISFFQRQYQGTAPNVASVHYCINSGYQDNGRPAGEVTQMVEEKYWAWHALCWNKYMFGIEHEGFVNNPAWFTSEMYDSSSKLVKYLCDKYSIPIDRNHIIGHDEKKNSSWVNWVNSTGQGFDPTCNTHTDPGTNWNWTGFMNKITLDPPTLLSPAANATITSSSVNFDWSDVSGAESYRIQVSDDPNYINLLLNFPAEGSKTTSSYYNGFPVVAGKKYYWHVRVNTGGSNTSDWTERIFTTGCSAPAQPGTISGNSTVCEGSNQSYSISSVSGATSYTWILPNNWTYTENSTTVSCKVPTGSTGGTIKVCANNACGSSSFSTLSVTVNSLPATTTVIGGGTFCNSAILTASGGNGGTIYWQGTTSNGTSTSTSSSSQTVISSGIYYFRSYNSCGWGTQGSANVTINTIPAQPGTITGSTTVTSGNTYPYSISTISDATSYTWKYNGVTQSGTGTSITLSPTSSGTLSVNANNSCGSSSPTSLNIVVNALSISSNILSLSSTINSNGTISITSNTSWTASSNQSWLTVTPTSGSNNGTLTLTANSANTTTTARTATVTVTGTGVNAQTITITQQGTSPSLSLSANTLSLNPAINSNSTITITSNTSWTASSNQSWLTVSTTSGSNNGTLILTANSANTTTSARTATVTVTGTGVTTQTITVTQQGTSLSLSLSANTLSLNSAINSNGTIIITSNTSWTASSNQSWLTVSPTSGSNNGTLTLTAISANVTTTSRTATVTVSGTGVTAQTITVTQQGTSPSLTLSGNTLSLNSAINSNGTISITSNTSWTASSNQTWLTVSPTSGSNNGTLTLTANSANTTTTARTATVTVTGSGVTVQTITVTQLGTSPSLSLSGNTLSLNYTINSSGTITITSNTSWTGNSNQTWLIVSPTTGSNNGTLTLTATSANTSTTSRIATVTVSGTGVTAQTITVTQLGTGAALSLSANALSLNSAINSNGTISITSNTSWTASSNQAWLTVSPTSGSNNGTLTLTANSANTTTTARTATVTVTGSGVSAQTIIVTQLGTAVGSEGDLRMHSPILSKTYPNSITDNILIKDQLSDISFSILNSQDRTINRAVKLYIIKSDNSYYDVLWDSILVFNSKEIKYLDRNIAKRLGSSIKYPVGKYTLVVKSAVTDNLNDITVSSNYIIDQGWGYGGNNVSIEIIMPEITSGLVAYYPFNGNANDESGNGNNGTVQGNVVLTTDRFGKTNKAYEFPGIAFNYIQVPDAPSLQMNIFTLNAWIYTSTDYGSSQVIQKGRDISNGHYGLYTTSVGGTNLYSGVNGTSAIPQPTIGVWHMVSGSVSGNKAKFYLDGKFMKDTILSNPFVCSGTEPLAIGMHYYAGVPSAWTYPFKGKMDDIRIYNRQLSDIEITNLYNLTPTALNNINATELLKLYPNPANTFLQISSPEILQRIEVCDIAGRLIFTKTINSDKFTLETNELLKGIYIVKGFTDNGVVTGRFVKE